MRLKAELHHKYKYLMGYNCVVEKTIHLSGEQFDLFSDDLLRDWDFIKENADLMRLDDNDEYRCLLVTGEGRENGILVCSEGYNYARYAAHVPNVHSIIAMDRYPALASLCKKLTDMADHIVNEAQKLPSGESRAEISMDDLEEMSGIDISRNSAIKLTLASMLSNRPEIADWELDSKSFIVTPLEHVMEQVHGQEPEITMSM